MVVLGPLDRRTIRKRCLECTRRKIKCEGGPPCLYCIKKKRKCVPHAIQPKTDVVFVSVSAASKSTETLSVVTPPPAPKLCLKVQEGNIPRFINHFFSDFLVRNDVGRAWDLSNIIPQFQNSPSLYYASIAVGALDMSGRDLLPSSIESKHTNMNALTAYHTSITKFQIEMANKNARLSDVNLWTTLFLGIFEVGESLVFGNMHRQKLILKQLMYDKTGEGWVKHILYGTSRILQLRGPDAHLSGPGRSFYLTVRVFEICRSIIYSEPTFLSHPKWKSLMVEIKREDPSDLLHPKEDLFDLMIECSSLAQRSWNFVKPDSKYAGAALTEGLLQAAVDGLIIRSALDDWYINFNRWSMEYDMVEQNAQSILSMVYFHGISIYLSGTFDYFPQFNNLVTASIPQALIQKHVDMILQNTKTALKTTNLSPVLLFFPLRVAGARVTTVQETESILNMLQDISERSFPVAHAFTEDLTSLWEQKGIGSLL